MLFLIFQVAGCPYAVQVERVTNIIPRLPTRPVPQAPPHLTGVIDHSGSVVPIIDLGMLLAGEPSSDRLHTRIILVDEPRPDSPSPRLGLIAEHVNTLKEAPKPDFDEETSLRGGSLLGPFLHLDGELVQMLLVSHIVDDHLRFLLTQVLPGWS